MNRNKIQSGGSRLNSTQLDSNGLPDSQIKNLMAAQILAGMCANPRNFKFEDEALASQAIALAEQIIERSSLH